jgi:hypothetical protein
MLIVFCVTLHFFVISSYKYICNYLEKPLYYTQTTTVQLQMIIGLYVIEVLQINTFAPFTLLLCGYTVFN